MTAPKSGGAGNDYFQYVDYFAGADTMAGGAGPEYLPASLVSGPPAAPAEITDFLQTGVPAAMSST